MNKSLEFKKHNLLNQIYKGITFKSYQDVLDKLYKDKPITLLTMGESNSKLKKGILIKLPKTKQDLRVDLPTIGIDTFKDCNEAGIKGIVIKSNQNIILNKEKIHIHCYPDRKKAGSRFYIHARNVADAFIFVLKNKYSTKLFFV